MYYTGIDPRDKTPVYVCRNPHERAMQRALIQYRDPGRYDLVREALIKGGREDLIGFGPKCLIRPYKPEKKPDSSQNRAARKPDPSRNHTGRKPEPNWSRAGQTAAPDQNRAARKKKKRTIRNVHKKNS